VKNEVRCKRYNSVASKRAARRISQSVLSMFVVNCGRGSSSKNVFVRGTAAVNMEWIYCIPIARLALCDPRKRNSSALIYSLIKVLTSLVF